MNRSCRKSPFSLGCRGGKGHVSPVSVDHYLPPTRLPARPPVYLPPFCLHACPRRARGGCNALSQALAKSGKPDAAAAVLAEAAAAGLNPPVVAWNVCLAALDRVWAPSLDIEIFFPWLFIVIIFLCLLRPSVNFYSQAPVPFSPIVIILFTRSYGRWGAGRPQWPSWVPCRRLTRCGCCAEEVCVEGGGGCTAAAEREAKGGSPPPPRQATKMTPALTTCQVSYNTVISACGRRGQFGAAAEVLPPRSSHPLAPFVSPHFPLSLFSFLLLSLFVVTMLYFPDSTVLNILYFRLKGVRAYDGGAFWCPSEPLLPDQPKRCYIQQPHDDGNGGGGGSWGLSR